MTTVKWPPAKKLRGTVRPPADKSISHRAAILGAMAAEPVRVRNYLHAEDTTSTLNAMRALGALVTVDDAKLAEYAGVKKYRYGETDEEDQVGIVTGLANPAGDDEFIGIGFAVPIGTAGGAAGAPGR